MYYIFTLLIVKRDLEGLIAQIPDYWDAHEKLEFIKVSIRSVISDKVGRNRKILNNEILDLESTLNEMCELRTKASSIIGINERKLDLIEGAIGRTDNDLRILREKQSSETNFRARAKWFEYGEKSNKYLYNTSTID